MACGSRLMPTPSGWISGAASNTRQEMPAWCRLSASVSPPMPPPTISTSDGSGGAHSGDDPAAGDHLGPALAVAHHDRFQRVRRRGGRHHALRLEDRPWRRAPPRMSAISRLRRSTSGARRRLGREQAVPHVDIGADRGRPRSGSARRAAAAGAWGCRRRSPSACRRGCAGPRHGPAGTCSRSGRPAGPAPRRPCPCRARAAARCRWPARPAPSTGDAACRRRGCRRSACRAGLGGGDQLGQRVGRLGGIGDQHQRAPGRQADRREVASPDRRAGS